VPNVGRVVPAGAGVEAADNCTHHPLEGLWVSLELIL
jgi:hypothetical protein